MELICICFFVFAGSSSAVIEIFVLHNPSLTQPATLSLVLSSPYNAALTDPSTALVSILDNNVPTTLVLPAPPAVNNMPLIDIRL